MKKQALGIIAALFAFMAALSANAAELSAADAYAILYEDGTLVFQNGAAPEPGRAVKETYEVDLTTGYTIYFDNNTFEWVFDAPWSNELESIRVVDFAERISPTSMVRWFYLCTNLERVDNIENLDTSNVTNMEAMFCDCNKLAALDVSHFDTANVTNMEAMFANCSALTALDLSHFDTFNVTSMTSMFFNCSELTALDLSHFDTANVMDISYMFGNCSNLKTIYVSDKFTVVSGSEDVFYDCTSLVGGNGTKYDESHINYDYARIDAPDTPGYFTYKPFASPRPYVITAAVTDEDAGTLSVTLVNSDAATLTVSYFDAAGKFISVRLQDIPADAGTVALALAADAKTARVMLLDGALCPLCAAYGVALAL